jgi:flagellar motor component MotA
MERAEFEKAYLEIARLALDFAEQNRKQGLLSLEERIDTEKAAERDIFHYGMQFAVDGTDSSFVDKILTNIINQEKDEDEKLLKIIRKEAVLGIQAGDNPIIIAIMLGSYVNNELAKATRKFCEK